MRLINKKTLEKLKRKNKGNIRLTLAIDQLVNDIEKNHWKNKKDLTTTRPDADCVHSEGFYFFDMYIHRTLVLVEFYELEATIVWAGDHSDYEITFKNNKHTIERWLNAKGWI